MEAIIVGILALIGTFSGHVISYKKSKEDREAGISDAHKAEEERWKRLNDRLEAIEEKLDAHNRKLDAHNGFEKRIIALEVIAEYHEKEVDSLRKSSSKATV